MTFADFLVTYSIDRLEFGDSTKYIYEGIYEVFEGKKIDLTAIDNLSMTVFDSELIEEELLEEEIITEIQNGNLPVVLSKNQERLNWINNWIDGKVTKADAAYYNKVVNQLPIPSNVQDKWVQQMMKTNPGASNTIWKKIKNVFTKYNNGEYSAAFTAKADAAQKAMSVGIANPASSGLAVGQMKAFLAKGASWLMNPANFSTIVGSVGGLMAFYLVLKLIKRRKIKKLLRKKQERELLGDELLDDSLLTEEQNMELKKNFEIIKEMSKKYKEVNRIFNGLTAQNCPILDY